MNVEVKQDAKGVWYAQPYLGRTVDGKQIRPRKSFPDAGTRAQAQELANEWVAGISAGGQVKSLFIADMLAEYRKERAAKDIAPSTVRRWETSTKYVAKYLAGKTVTELTVMDFNDFETRLLLPKEKNGQGLSRNTVRGVHYFLRGAYNHWVNAGICDGNPMFYVQEPSEEKHEAIAIDEWDFETLNKALSSELAPETHDAGTMRQAAYSFAAWLALHTGMRVGEVCAVRRRDVSRRLGYIHVCGTVVELRGGVERRDTTKSKRSRNVSLTEKDFATVYAFIGLQDGFCGSLTPNAPLVTVDGSFMRPNTVSKAFSRLRDRLGLPKTCTFHSLRHTHATWCLAEGVDLKTLSERLGHADESTTLKTYAHLMKGRDQAAAQAFESFADSIGGV